jgi:hypothetical protein
MEPKWMDVLREIIPLKKIDAVHTDVKDILAKVDKILRKIDLEHFQESEKTEQKTD